jgi:hypothetical protein
VSRFGDPLARRTVPIGECQCPGAPHETDEATFRWDLGGSALARIGRAEIEGAVRMDPLAAYRQVVLETLESWNLLWLDPTWNGNGTGRKTVPVPITTGTIAELDADTLKFLAETADGLISERGELPNASGAPSAPSRRGSASRTPRRTRKPTTSSSPSVPAGL